MKELYSKEKIDLSVKHSALSYALTRFSKFKIAPTVWVFHDLIKDRMATGNPYNRIETLLQLFIIVDINNFIIIFL